MAASRDLPKLSSSCTTVSDGPIETRAAYFASIQVSDPASLDGHIREQRYAAACRRRCRGARLRYSRGPAFL